MLKTSIRFACGARPHRDIVTPRQIPRLCVRHCCLLPSAHNSYRRSMQNDIATWEPVRAAGLEKEIECASAETIDHLHYIMVLRGKPPLTESAKERTREALVRLLKNDSSSDAEQLVLCVMQYYDLL